MEAIKDAIVAKDYLTAGNSILTLRSKVTSNRITVAVVASEKPEDSSMYFVKYLNGSDNSKNYSYAGILLEKDGCLDFKLTKASKITEDSVVYKAFSFLVKNINKNRINEDLEVLPSNTCCRCGALLTTPESIKNGIGPECIRISRKKGKWKSHSA